MANRDLKIISGLQQIGIGNQGLHPLWRWYRETFGMNIRIFEEAAEAPHMVKYTGNEVVSRHAALALNMQGGSGFEIWELMSRRGSYPDFELKLGDLGIFIAKVKSRNVKKAYEAYKKRGLNILGELSKDPNGKPHFYIKDPEGNIFEVVEGSAWFGKTRSLTGGGYGAVIGVRDLDESLKLFRDILEYDKVVYDKSGRFDDFSCLNGGETRFRRILLENSKPRQGAFAPLLNGSQIELVQILEGEKGRKIFQNRHWGDMGFIHLCFDVRNMDVLKKECEEKGFPFTVDSANTFDMGEAGGRFAYIEDPDGTLIEFVETHKVPIMKNLKWYLNLKDRDPQKPLPRWMLKAMGMSKVKD